MKYYVCFIFRKLKHLVILFCQADDNIFEDIISRLFAKDFAENIVYIEYNTYCNVVSTQLSEAQWHFL